MKRKFLCTFALMLMCMTLTVSGLASSTEGSDIGVKRYSITRSIMATLTISEDGIASCAGTVKAIDPDSTCTVFTTLKRKNGANWETVKIWHKSGASPYGIKAMGSIAVSEGTYKVVVEAVVLAIDGTRESVTKSTAEKTYKK